MANVPGHDRIEKANPACYSHYFAIQTVIQQHPNNDEEYQTRTATTNVAMRDLVKAHLLQLPLTIETVIQQQPEAAKSIRRVKPRKLPRTQATITSTTPIHDRRAMFARPQVPLEEKVKSAGSRSTPQYFQHFASSAIITNYSAKGESLSRKCFKPPYIPPPPISNFAILAQSP